MTHEIKSGSYIENEFLEKVKELLIQNNSIDLLPKIAELSNKYFEEHYEFVQNLHDYDV